MKWCTKLFKVLPFLFSMSTITILNFYIKTKENKVTRKKQEGFQYFTVNTKPLAKSHKRVRWKNQTSKKLPKYGENNLKNTGIKKNKLFMKEQGSISYRNPS